MNQQTMPQSGITNGLSAEFFAMIICMDCIVVGCKSPVRTKKYGYCRAHHYRWQRYGDPLFPDQRKPPAGATSRKCSGCTETKPLTEFGTNSVGAYGRKSTCRACEATEAREWRASLTPEARRQYKQMQRRSAVRGLYGEDGVAILERIQHGEACEICGGHTARMAIDHCHTTSKVRGLLCSNCNTALGLVGESVDRLQALIKYLETHNVS